MLVSKRYKKAYEDYTFYMMYYDKDDKKAMEAVLEETPDLAPESRRLIRLWYKNDKREKGDANG